PLSPRVAREADASLAGRGTPRAGKRGFRPALVRYDAAGVAGGRAQPARPRRERRLNLASAPMCTQHEGRETALSRPEFLDPSEQVRSTCELFTFADPPKGGGRTGPRREMIILTPARG